jgi:hypothetical protein
MILAAGQIAVCDYCPDMIVRAVEGPATIELDNAHVIVLELGESHITYQYHTWSTGEWPEFPEGQEIYIRNVGGRCLYKPLGPPASLRRWINRLIPESMYRLIPNIEAFLRRNNEGAA